MNDSNCLKAALLLALFPLLAACATAREYSAEPIEGWVVDDETGQPIEGAALVAHWELATRNRLVPHQIQPAGQLMVLEAVTDKAGRFHFPAWGPVAAPSGARLTPWYDPRLLIFKSGYTGKFVSNYTPVQPDLSDRPVRRSVWNGQTIKLKRDADTPAAVRAFEYLNDIGLGFVVNEPGQCWWKKMPRMLVEIERQSELFTVAGIRLNVRTVVQRLSGSDDFFAAAGNPECGSPNKFLQDIKR